MQEFSHAASPQPQQTGGMSQMTKLFKFNERTRGQQLQTHLPDVAQILFIDKETKTTVSNETSNKTCHHIIFI